MRRAGLILSVLIGVSAPAAPAWAQITLTPFAGVGFGGELGFVDLEETAGDPKAVYGAAVGWRMMQRLSLAFEAARMPRFLKDDGQLIERGLLTSLMAHVEYVLWSRSRSRALQLFVSGGAGVVRVDIDDVLGAFTNARTLPAGNVGAGVLVPLRNRLRFRSDVRYFRSTAERGGRAAFDEEHVSFWRVASGVSIEF